MNINLEIEERESQSGTGLGANIGCIHGKVLNGLER